MLEVALCVLAAGLAGWAGQAKEARDAVDSSAQGVLGVAHPSVVVQLAVRLQTRYHSYAGMMEYLVGTP